jgi:hypothetical protein
MSRWIRPRARMRDDRAGDPLDGLVNLFDLGVVLAVAFLLAALASLDLTGLLTRGEVTVVRSGPDGQTIITKRGKELQRLRLRPDEEIAGQGTRVGSVYRLPDGRLVYTEGR